MDRIITDAFLAEVNLEFVSVMKLMEKDKHKKATYNDQAKTPLWIFARIFKKFRVRQ
jgi:hypothetical protein